MFASLKSRHISLFIYGTFVLLAPNFTGCRFPDSGQLPLPSDLVSLHSDEGQVILAESDSGDFGTLSNGFVPQSWRSYCGVATIATTSRAAEDEGFSVKVHSEKDVFQSEAAMSVKNQLLISIDGLTLLELSQIFNAVGVKTKVVYANESELGTFTTDLQSVLSDRSSFMIANYSRGALAQEGIGHISPIAAFSASRGMLLVIDEAADKYPFTWVPVERFFNAMDTADGDKSRGYLIVTFD